MLFLVTLGFKQQNVTLIDTNAVAYHLRSKDGGQVNIPTDQEFSKLIGQALDELPEKYTSKLANVVITYEDEPTAEQHKKLGLRCNQSLFGLYEGIPLTQRGSGFSGQLPDKITLFKLPLFHFTNGDEEKFKAQIKHTLWHEIAHYFGLNHDRIHQLEQK